MKQTYFHDIDCRLPNGNIVTVYGVKGNGIDAVKLAKDKVSEDNDISVDEIEFVYAKSFFVAGSV